MFKRIVEVSVGLFMLVGFFAFVILSFKVSGLTQYTNSGFYEVKASFDNIGGLKVRAPIRVAGVRIGEVGRIGLDQNTYRADVTLLLEKHGSVLPVDTAASILTEGLLGANYISLTPGFEKETLKEGSRIEETHSAIILENMISHFLFSMKKDENSKSDTEVKSSATKKQ